MDMEAWSFSHPWKEYIQTLDVHQSHPHNLQVKTRDGTKIKHI